MELHVAHANSHAAPLATRRWRASRPGHAAVRRRARRSNFTHGVEGSRRERWQGAVRQLGQGRKCLERSVDCLDVTHCFAVAYTHTHVNEMANVDADPVRSHRKALHRHERGDLVCDVRLSVLFGAPDRVDVALHQFRWVQRVTAP
eukprot:scaffold257999_cov32-Tisochrysis_lutea.AAC.7